MVQPLLQVCPGPGYEIQASGSLLVLAGCAVLLAGVVLGVPLWLWMRHRSARSADRFDA
jgi:hypothetical protein